MQLRHARLGVLLGAVAALAVATVPPAAATTVKASVFSGTLAVSGSLKNVGPNATPCTTHANPLDCVTVTTGPNGEPRVTVSPGGNTVAFTFSSSVCLKLTVSTPGESKPTGVALCSVTATGIVTGFNGLATGVGTLWSTDLGGTKGTFTTSFTFTVTGDVLTLVGGTVEDAFRAVIVKEPDPEPEPTQEDPPPPQPRQASGLSGSSSD